MAIYEVQVARRIMGTETATICVRARGPEAARKKALAAVKKNADQWFGPIDTTGVVIESDGVEKLDFEPDCEVL